MKDLLKYHEKEQEIAQLKKELREANAKIKSLKNKVENKVKHKTKYCRIAYKIGAGEKQAFIRDDLRVSSATVTEINKLVS